MTRQRGSGAPVARSRTVALASLLLFASVTGCGERSAPGGAPAAETQASSPAPVTVPLAATPVTPDAETPASGMRAPDGQWTVVVHDSSDQPVSGAFVQTWHSAAEAGATPYDSLDRTEFWDGKGRDPRPTVQPPAAVYTTDSSGSCVIGLPSRDVVFLAEREGLGDSGLWYARAVWEHPARSTTVTLRPGDTIHGRVLDSDDQPVAAATVQFIEAVPLKTWDAERSGRGDPRRPGDVVTSDAGSFEAPSDYGFHGMACAFSGNVASSVEHAMWAGTATNPVTLRLAGRFAIQGVVTDVTGEPLAGARVTARRPLSHQVETRAGDDGAFELELFEPGRYPLAAKLIERPDLIMAEPVVVSLTEQMPVAVQDIEFIPSASISGTARWVDGSPADPSWVRAEPIEGPDRPLDFA
jgi:protocatechuate 3,4-dioxygenase beta subunit